MASTGDTWRLGRRPALDGLRGVAVLLVVVSHSLIGTPLVLAGGVVGVTLFFALSGYLITGLLIPQASAGRFNVRGFYARRARRLLPALAVLFPVVAWLLWIFRDPYLRTYPREVLASLLYVRNLVHFDRGLGYDGVLGHMWSLAVEEQFYLLWPVVLVGTFATARRLRVKPLTLVGGLFALALVWRVAAAVASVGPFPYSRLDTNAVALLAGAVVAVAESSGLVLGTRRLALVGLAVIVVLANWPRLSFGVDMWAGIAVAVCAIPLLSRAGDGLSFLAHPALRWFGKVSYGWYLWHVPLICIWINGQPPSLTHRWIASAVALGLAALSYRYVEQPFLRPSSTSHQHAASRPAETVAAGTAA